MPRHWHHFRHMIEIPRHVIEIIRPVILKNWLTRCAFLATTMSCLRVCMSQPLSVWLSYNYERDNIDETLTSDFVVQKFLICRLRWNFSIKTIMWVSSIKGYSWFFDWIIEHKIHVSLVSVGHLCDLQGMLMSMWHHDVVTSLSDGCLQTWKKT